MSNEPEEFDLEAVYDAEINPLMAKIIEICRRHKMPMLASFCYASGDDGEVDLCTTNLPFGDRQPEAFKEAAAALTRPTVSFGMMITTKDDGSKEVRLTP